MKKITLLFIIAGLGAVGLQGEEAGAVATSRSAPARLTLEEALAEARTANRSLKSLGHRRNAARHDAKALARSRWGELGGTFSYSYLNDDQVIRPMSKQLMEFGFLSLPFDRQQLHYGVNYRIPLYLGGRLNNEIKIARLESRKTEALLEGTRWQVRFNVISLYTAAQALDQVLASLDEQLAALEQTRSRLDLMVQQGKRPEVDRLKVVEELEGVKARRAGTAAQRAKVGAMLCSLLGREPTGRLRVDPLPEETPSLDTDRNELRFALQGNSMIRQAQLAIEQGESSVKVARSSFLPKIYAGANYLEHTGATIDRTEETWMAGVTVELPLFVGTSRFQRMDAARERHAAARAALEDAQLKLGAELEDALAQWDAAHANVKSARAQIAAASEAARIEQVRYDTGAGTIEDLLRARAREEGARAALASARGELLTAAARINSLVEQEIVK